MLARLTGAAVRTVPAPNPHPNPLPEYRARGQREYRARGQAECRERRAECPKRENGEEGSRGAAEGIPALL